MGDVVAPPGSRNRAPDPCNHYYEASWNNIKAWISVMATVVNLLKASSLLSSLTAHPLAFTIIVQNVTFLGPQLNPDVTNVSRDGGYSVLINGRIVWLYDDTECMDSEGNQLSFVSNTAAYQAGDAGNDDISSVNNFGLASLGADKNGRSRMTILPNTDVGKGGWIPFQTDELRFNAQMKGKERVAICKLYITSYCLFNF